MNGSIDRRALGAIVFADPAARRDLEQIIHPLVRARTEAWFQAQDDGSHRFAVADIPLLFESGNAAAYDVAAAYEIYRDFLAPVENGWQSAKNLIVVSLQMSF